VRVDASDGSGYENLTGLLNQNDAGVRLFYLATLPALYGTICSHLQQAGAVDPRSRVVLEKPLGHDLASCHAINLQVATVFSEENTFRIDHYLGKETVQNVMAVRFGNPLLHPV